MIKIVKIQPDTLTDIAEAIREKTETTELIPTVEMAQRIRDIETLPTDATATEVDLLIGKVAYNNEGRFVGTIETFGGETGDGEGYYTDYNDIIELVENRNIPSVQDKTVTRIGAYAFAYTNLRDAVFKNVSYIDYCAFYNCDIKNLFLGYNGVVQINNDGNYDIFAFIDKVTVHVKEEYVEDYNSNADWKSLIDKGKVIISGDYYEV